jgi:hypothetical protein
VRNGFLELACLLVLSTWVIPATAGMTQSSFNVKIKLHNPEFWDGTGYCISGSLSEDTNAIVRVVCKTDRFVSIDPKPGNAFLGMHGGAYRYLFEPDLLVMPPDDDLWHMGVGTVTSIRINHVEGLDDQMEVWVSF